MPSTFENRIMESTVSTGIGPVALEAVAGWRRFGAKLAVNATCHYVIAAVDVVGRPTGEVEWGIGTYNAENTLTRTTVIGSSNNDARLNLAAGTKMVALTALAPTTSALRADWRAAIGLDMLDNTSDANKPISTATAAALAGKQASLGFVPVQQGTGVGQSNNTVKIGWSGAAKLKATVDTTDIGNFAFESQLTKAGVGLGNVDNTSDANKPISTATQNALNAKAPTSNPTFTGTVTAPQINSLAAVALNLVATTGDSGRTSQYLATASPNYSSMSVEAVHFHGNFASWRLYLNGLSFDHRQDGWGEAPAGWRTSSDVRLKERLQVLDSALDKVDLLTGYTYDRPDLVDTLVDPGRVPRHAGLIAQDAQKALPEAVNEGSDGFLKLSYDAIVALLVNAVKELRADVRSMREELRAE